MMKYLWHILIYHLHILLGKPEGKRPLGRPRCW